MSGRTLFDEPEPETGEPTPPAPKAKPSKYPPLPEFVQEPTHHGASLPERLDAGAYLAGLVGECEAGTATAHELYRVLRGTLYVLSDGEVLRVAKGLVNLLGANRAAR